MLASRITSGRPWPIWFLLVFAALFLFGPKVTGDSLGLIEDTGTPTDSLKLDDSRLVVSSETDVVDPSGESASLYPMSPERKARLVSYARFKNIWRFVGFVISIGVLWLILVTGLAARMRDWARVAGRRFFVIWLFLGMFAVADYILSLPFNIYRGFVVESNYGFMNQTFLEWWGQGLLGLLITVVIGIIPIWFFYWLVRKFRRWWLVFSIGAIPFAVVIIVIVPVFVAPLFNKFEPLRDKQLETELLALASRAGIEGADVFQVDASRQSSKINAYVTGLFGSKRIVLYDTLIDNFTVEEIKFVMAHEMGHYTMHHIWWGLAVAIVFISFALWLVAMTIHPLINRFRERFRFDRLSDIASLPLVLIFLSVIMFLFQPATNAVSRLMERQADTYGMDMSGVSGETGAVVFDKLSVFNLSDPDPHPVIEFWFYSHPSLKKRMEFVRGYRPAR
ncbi:MAG: M48 family metallopeptidase [candidate division Zixibacteria bacterium]|nr:M48 family metallopeptidase [candidate division Zixibacteria bacterium]